MRSLEKAMENIDGNDMITDDGAMNIDKLWEMIHKETDYDK